MPWEGPRDGGNGALFSIGGTNTGCWAYGNPAVAITRDFDPYLATALQSMNKPLSDGVYAMANKQNYLSSAKYFFCPLSYYTYQKNYGRYGSEFTSPTNPNLMWGTDTWYYNHKYDPANEADPGHLNFITYQHSNPESATVLLSDFHSYNWCDPATPYMLQQKPHWNFLMLDGSVKPFTDIKKVFAFMWSNQPAARNQVFDETGCSGPLPPWTPGL
jgi:hypothetical protein